MNQSTELMATYGEVMLYGHIIEDLLKMHLVECSVQGINGYEKGLGGIRKLNQCSLVKELESVYRDSDDVHGLCDNLHKLRKIRNAVTHAFIKNVGNDLATEIGRDQIHGLLSKVSRFQHYFLRVLQTQHEKLLRMAASDLSSLMIERPYENELTDVSGSEIQMLIQEIEQTIQNAED